MRKKTTITILSLMVMAAPVSANAQNAQALILGQNQTETYLRAGTPIALTLSEELTTKGKNLRTGYRFRMQVSEPVMLNGVIVIPAGSPAMEEVTDVRNKGMWGKSGKINARVLHVTVNGRVIRLAGQIDDKGITGTAAVVGAIAFVPLAGFLTTGTSARIPMGSPIPAFIDEDVPVVLPKSSQTLYAQPLTVEVQNPAPQAPQAQQAPVYQAPAIQSQPRSKAIRPEN